MNNRKAMLNGTLFTNGDYVTFLLDGDNITDARIYIGLSPAWGYLCQDNIRGDTAPDQFGYKYSYSFTLEGRFPEDIRLSLADKPCNKPRDK